ncbi:SGNH hydrolase domain-containing protein, partial [Aeromonas veronii]
LMFGKPAPQISISLEEYHARHQVVWAAQDAAAAQCGVKILDPLPYLCHDGRCWGSKDGRPIYYDDDHLSEYGNKLLVPMFKQVFATSASQ